MLIVCLGAGEFALVASAVILAGPSNDTDWVLFLVAALVAISGWPDTTQEWRRTALVQAVPGQGGRIRATLRRSTEFARGTASRRWSASRVA